MTEMEMGIGLFLCNNIVSSVKIIKVQLQRISVGFKGVDLRFLLHFKNSDSPSVLAAYSQAPARGRLWVTVQVWAGSCGSRSIRGEMIVSRLWGHRPPPAPRSTGWPEHGGNQVEGIRAQGSDCWMQMAFSLYLLWIISAMFQCSRRNATIRAAVTGSMCTCSLMIWGHQFWHQYILR